MNNTSLQKSFKRLSGLTGSRFHVDTSSLHILNIELKNPLFSTEIAISGNLHLWLGHFTCSKRIFYGWIGNFCINRIFFIILGDHSIKKLVFEFFWPNLVLCHASENTSSLKFNKTTRINMIIKILLFKMAMEHDNKDFKNKPSSFV